MSHRHPRHARPNSPKRLRFVITAAAVASTLVAGTAVYAATSSAQAAYYDGAVVVNDTMNRSVSPGWGAAPVGGAYTISSPSSFSINGANGSVSLPTPAASRTATLSTVSVRDVRAGYALAIDSLAASGNGTSTGVQLRVNGGSYYRADVRIAAGGAATLQIVRINGDAAAQTTLASSTLPFTIGAHQLAHIEFQATGTTSVDLAARVWTSSMTKPGWQTTATDSSAARLSGAGAIGLWSYESKTSTSARLAIDNLVATELTTTPNGSTPTTTPSQPATPAPSPTPSQTPTATPSPTPTQPAGPTAPDPGSSATAPASATRISAGSAPIGSTAYAIPAGAYFVSTSGSDSAAGSLSAPFKTVGKAISAAPSGSTIVVRAGSYHEGITISGKTLTIQSYPHEAVWLDGSSVVGTWAKSSTGWVSGGWTAQFDSSPTYTFGAPDGTSANWQFVNPKYPLAAHPDQVWIDGVAQTQVASASAVKPGTFAVDYASKQLYLGTDPAGHTVRASDIAKAVSIRGDNSVIRGIGIRRFAPSVAHMGAVTAEKPGITLENLVISDNATTGLFVMQSGSTVRNVTLSHNGMLGASMSTSDNLTVTGVLAFDNNTEHFNNSPVSGGVKISRSRNVTVSKSVFVDNLGPGLWFDESVYNGKVAGNDIVNNAGHGLITEISAKFDIVDNLVTGNTDNGMKINDTSGVRIWNNTVTGNVRNINIVQDTRRASNTSIAGHDPRQPLPDPTVTWINGPVEVRNNIIGDAKGGANCLLCVEDYSAAFSAKAMGVTAQGNVYQRANAQTPSALVIWSQGAAAASQYSSLAAFQTGAGQDSTGIETTGSAVLGSKWTLISTLASQAATRAQAIPADLAAEAGVASGSKQLGAWAN